MNVPARNTKSRTSIPLPPVVTSPPARPGRFMSAVRAAFGVTLVIGIAGGTAYAGRRYVKTSPRFSVSEIVTTGAKRRTPDEIASLAGVAKGENVFATDLDRAKARLLEDPWISDASLARQLPGTIYVRVTEREAAGLLAMNDGSYLVTRDGAVIKRLEAGDPTDVPVVTGIRTDQLVDDREGAARTVKRALDLAAEYDRSVLAQRAGLEEVHVEAGGDMTLVIGKKTTTLYLGAPPYRRKLDQAVRVMAELDRRGAKVDAIRLDDDARPDRVVVRMR